MNGTFLQFAASTDDDDVSDEWLTHNHFHGAPVSENVLR